MSITVLQPRTRTQSACATVLDCHGLTKRLGPRLAVDDVSLSIGSGETYGLLGPKGAGKTTMLRMICGLLLPDAGWLTVAGERMGAGATSARRRVGYVPPEIAFLSDLTASENLRLFGRRYGLDRRTLRRRVDDLLSLVDLADRRNDRVKTFTGTMRRRLSIAAGLVHEPALLVLDEPTLDPQSRHTILDILRRVAQSGLAILYASDDMKNTEWCTRVGLIDAGRLVAEGRTDEIIRRVARHTTVAVEATGDLERFVAACRRLPGVMHAAATGTGVHLIADNRRQLRSEVVAAAARVGAQVQSCDVDEPTLEDVFPHLTGAALSQ